MPRLSYVMNDVCGIEGIVAVEEHHHADQQREKAMISPDRSVSDFFAHINHERHTRGVIRQRICTIQNERVYITAFADCGTTHHVVIPSGARNPSSL